MDYKLDQLLSLSLRQTPPQSLQSRAHFYLFSTFEQEFFNPDVVERRQLLLHLHQLLSWIDWVQRGQWHLPLHTALEALTADALDSWRWQHSLHRMESILKRVVYGLYLLLEAIVRTAHRVRHSRNNMPVLHGHLLHLHHLHLLRLLVILNKSWFHHINTVVALDFVAVVQQELLIATEFVLDRLNRHFVDGLADLEGVKCRLKLFRNVENIFRE